MWEPWPEGGVDKNYILHRQPDAGRVCRLGRPSGRSRPGEPLSEAKIVAPGNRGFLAAVLRAGMRAVSVPVNITSGISGFIFPGDQVDLVITYSVQETASPAWPIRGLCSTTKSRRPCCTTFALSPSISVLDAKAGEAKCGTSKPPPSK